MLGVALRSALVLVAVAALVSAPALVGTAPRAFACSCPAASVEPEKLTRSEIVFEGTPLARDGDVGWTFRVDRVYRGPATAERRVVTGSPETASCGTSFTLGEPYLVDGRTDEDDTEAVRTGLCSMTRSIAGWTPADRQAVVQRVGPGTPPPPSPEPTVTDDDGSVTAVVAGVAVAALALATAAAVRRRRRR